MTKQLLNELSFTEEDSSLQEKLINCVKQNQYEAVKEFVENGAKLNAPFYGKLKPPLYWAVVKGHYEIAELLIKNGAYTNYNDDETKNSLLDLVLTSENLEVLRLLLENGADPAKNFDAAIQLSNWKRLLFLIKNGANVDTKSGSNSITPLYHAVVTNDKEMVETFIELGANPNVRALDDSSPLHFAIENGNIDIAEILLKNKAIVDICDERTGIAPIHLATNSSVEMVKLLLRYGADPNVKCNFGMTPLHYFATSQTHDFEIGKLLIENGASINSMDKRNYSPLYLAILEDNLNAVRDLLENGAKVQDCEEINKSLLLIRAINNTEDEIAELLVENGADLEIKTHFGCTPLAVAMLKKRYKVVESLICNGANTNTRFYDSAGDFGTPLIHYAIKLKDVKFLKLLAQNSAHLEEIHNGNTPLMHACMNCWGSLDYEKDFVILKLLLENGANPNIKRKGIHQFTPLHVAAKFCDEKFVNVLLKYGANQNLRSGDGNSSLETVLKMEDDRILKTMINWIHCN